MRKMLFSCLVIALATVGCSQLSNRTSTESQTPDTGPTKASAVKPLTSAKGTQITWETPSEPVDGFVIRYGTNPKQLGKEIKVSANDLRQEQDPEYGAVYRYVIKNGSEAAPLYVSVAAFKGDRLSDFSTVIEER